MHALVLLFLAPPGDVVQTHDLGTMTWQRAKALEGRRVRARFTVDHVEYLGDVPFVIPESQGGDCRLVCLRKYKGAALTKGARLEAEGVLRVTWLPLLSGDAGEIEVELEDARLVR